MQGRVNPGNISVRIGKVLELFELAVAESKLATAANMVDVLADYISVYPDFDIDVYAKMPGFTYGDPRHAHEIFSDLRKRMRYVLAAAKKNSVFAWHTPAIGDGSDLDKESEGGAEAA